ncbi:MULTISPECIES: hypothetical protein [Oceanobacillus]|nr:hypothetical protein [Oceanobacillus profundus]MDO6449331.1 hypothetical protein [Oceanobacillus profundus]
MNNGLLNYLIFMQHPLLPLTSIGLLLMDDESITIGVLEGFIIL